MEEIGAPYDDDEVDFILCKVCNIKMISETSYKIHLTTHQHLKKEDSLVALGKANRGRALPVWTSYTQYLDHLQLDEPIIGLNHLVRVPGDGAELKYLCRLCFFEADMPGITNHVVGRKHRQKYLVANRSDLVTWDASNMAQPGKLVRAKAEVVERQDGRGTPEEPKIKLRAVKAKEDKPRRGLLEAPQLNHPSGCPTQAPHTLNPPRPPYKDMYDRPRDTAYGLNYMEENLYGRRCAKGEPYEPGEELIPTIEEWDARYKADLGEQPYHKWKELRGEGRYQRERLPHNRTHEQSTGKERSQEAEPGFHYGKYYKRSVPYDGDEPYDDNRGRVGFGGDRGPVPHGDNRGPAGFGGDRGRVGFGDDRGPVPHGDNRGPAGLGGDRGRLGFGDDRGPLPHGDNRGPAGFGGDRGRVGFGDDRGPVPHSDNRGPAEFGDDRRPPGFEGNRRPAPCGDDRGQPGFGDNRGQLGFEGNRRSAPYGDDRGPRSFGDNRGQPGFEGNRRPASYGDDRGQPGFGDNRRPAPYGDDRGPRSFGDNRGQPGFEGNRRPASYGDDRGQPGFGDNRRPAPYGDGSGPAGFADDRRRPPVYGDNRRPGPFDEDRRRTAPYQEEDRRTAQYDDQYDELQHGRDERSVFRGNFPEGDGSRPEEYPTKRLRMDCGSHMQGDYQEQVSRGTTDQATKQGNVLNVLKTIEIKSMEEANFIKDKLCDLLKEFQASKSENMVQMAKDPLVLKEYNHVSTEHRESSQDQDMTWRERQDQYRVNPRDHWDQYQEVSRDSQDCYQENPGNAQDALQKNPRDPQDRCGGRMRDPQGRYKGPQEHYRSHTRDPHAGRPAHLNSRASEGYCDEHPRASQESYKRQIRGPRGQWEDHHGDDHLDSRAHRRSPLLHARPRRSETVRSSQSMGRPDQGRSLGKEPHFPRSPSIDGPRFPRQSGCERRLNRDIGQGPESSSLNKITSTLLALVARKGSL